MTEKILVSLVLASEMFTERLPLIDNSADGDYKDIMQNSTSFNLPALNLGLLLGGLLLGEFK